MKQILLVAISVLLIQSCSSPQQIKAIAEQNLQGYAPSVKLTPGTCVGSDSDADGYVSCSAVDKTNTVQTVLCSTQAGVGCKPFVPSVEDDD